VSVDLRRWTGLLARRSTGRYVARQTRPAAQRHWRPRNAGRVAAGGNAGTRGPRDGRLCRAQPEQPQIRHVNRLTSAFVTLHASAVRVCVFNPAGAPLSRASTKRATSSANRSSLLPCASSWSSVSACRGQGSSSIRLSSCRPGPCDFPYSVVRLETDHSAVSICHHVSGRAAGVKLGS
jgi:hypothetical protein